MDPAFFGLDPLFWTFVKLFIKDILKLKPCPDRKSIYTFFDHHIRYTQLCGVIVAVEQTPTMVIYTVDDASGVVPCIRWKDNIKKEETISIGDCVRVSGRISTYKDTRQIKIYDIAVLTNPNLELLFNLEIMTLRRDHYSKPFVIPTRIMKHQQDLKKELEIEKGALPMVLSQDMNQTMDNVLLGYLEDTFGTTMEFSLADLESDTTLRNLTRPFFNEHDPTSFKKLLSKTFDDLLSEGNFITTSPNRFVLFDDHDLEIEILHTIRSTLDQHGRSKLVGVNHRYICNKVQERYRQLSTKKISKYICALDENSIIYRTDAMGKGAEFCDYRIMDD